MPKPKLFPLDSAAFDSEQPRKTTPWQSMFVTAVVCFCQAAQFSLYFSSMWPYLQLLDPTATENFFGYVMAGYSLGAMLAAPVMGFWSSTARRVVPPMYGSLVCALIGNIIYFATPLLPTERKYGFFVARVFVGFAESIITLCSIFTATASLPKDRSRSIALLNGGLCVGICIGPMFQLLFTPLGYPGVQLFGRLRLHMYSAPAAFSCILNIFSVFCIRFLFVERYAGLANDGKKKEEKTVKLPPPDRVGVLLCFLMRFTQSFTFTNLETMGSPFIMTMFAMSRAEAVQNFAAAHSVMGLLGILSNICYTVIRLDKWIDFRKICLIGAAMFMVFHLLTFPWPFISGHLETYSEKDYALYLAGNLTEEPVGCAADRFSWCATTTPVNYWLYFISLILVLGCAFPFTFTAMSTIFSHVIGPRRQDRQQSTFQMVSSFARLAGPVLMSNIYSAYGPSAAWIMEMVVIGIDLILWVIFYKRLVPLEVPKPIEEVNSQPRISVIAFPNDENAEIKADSPTTTETDSNTERAI